MSVGWKAFVEKDGWWYCKFDCRDVNKNPIRYIGGSKKKFVRTTLTLPQISPERAESSRERCSGGIWPAHIDREVYQPNSDFLYWHWPIRSALFSSIKQSILLGLNLILKAVSVGRNVSRYRDKTPPRRGLASHRLLSIFWKFRLIVSSRLTRWWTLRGVDW